MTAHTPGPWKVVPRKDGLANIYHGAGVRDVALCAHPDDARLIAAAPDLLALVKEMLSPVSEEAERRRIAGPPELVGTDTDYWTEMETLEDRARALLATLEP